MYDEILGKRAKVLSWAAYIGEPDQTPDGPYFTYSEATMRRIEILSSDNAKALVLAYWAQREDRENESC